MLQTSNSPSGVYVGVHLGVCSVPLAQDMSSVLSQRMAGFQAIEVQLLQNADGFLASCHNLGVVITQSSLILSPRSSQIWDLVLK